MFSNRNLFSVSLKAIAPFLSLVVLLIVSRSLTPQDFGYFAFVLSAAQIGLNIGATGYNLASLRWLPKFSEANDHGEANAFLSSSFSYITLFTILVLAGFFALDLHLYLPIPKDSALPLILAISGLSFLAVTVGAARTQNANNLAIILNDIFFRTLFVIAVLSFRPDSLATIVYFYTMSIWAAVVVGLTVVYQSYNYRFCWPTLAWSVVKSASLRRFWLIALLTGAMAHLDVIMVAYTLEPEDVGIYAVAKRLSLLVSIFSIAAGFLTATKLARAQASGDVQAMQKHLRDTVLIGSVPALLVASFSAIFATALLGFMIQEPDGHSSLLILMLLTQLANCLFGPTQLALTQFGGERHSINIRLTSILLSAALIFFGSSFYGLHGAAAGYFISTIIWNLWAVAVIKNNYGVDTTILCLFSKR